MKEELGDLYKRNILGLLPQEMDHDQPIKNIPEDLKPYFLETMQEIEEGDYMIITNERCSHKCHTYQGKKNIIIEQLK